MVGELTAMLHGKCRKGLINQPTNRNQTWAGTLPNRIGLSGGINPHEDEAVWQVYREILSGIHICLPLQNGDTKMIQIEVNRWTIMKLEEAMNKYNKENPYSIHDYAELINRILELYLKQKKVEG